MYKIFFNFINHEGIEFKCIRRRVKKTCCHGTYGKVSYLFITSLFSIYNDLSLTLFMRSMKS